MVDVQLDPVGAAAPAPDALESVAAQDVISHRTGNLRMLGIVRHAAVLVLLPPLLPLFLTFPLALGLLMLTPEDIEHGFYTEQYDGECEER